jgi:hypothetical protein
VLWVPGRDGIFHAYVAHVWQICHVRRNRAASGGGSVVVKPSGFTPFSVLALLDVFPVLAGDMSPLHPRDGFGQAVYTRSGPSGEI